VEDFDTPARVMQRHVDRLLGWHRFAQDSSLPDGMETLPAVIVANCMLEVVRQLQEMNQTMRNLEETNRGI
jgi:hypothetical protein